MHIFSFFEYGSFVFEYSIFLQNPGYLLLIFGPIVTTGLIIALNVALAFLFYEVINKKKISLASSIVPIILLLIFITNFFFTISIDHSSEDETINIALIQPNFLQSWDWRQANVGKIIVPELLDLSEEAIAAGADIIVWPEYAIPIDFINYQPQFREALLSQIKKYNRSFIIGSIIANESKNTNYDVAIFISNEGKIVDYVGSTKPAPFNENVSAVTNKQVVSLEVNGQNITFGTIICYEEFFPDIAEFSFINGADIIISLVNNQDTYHGIRLASLFANSRAAENKIPIIRVANTGVSKIISSQGITLDEIAPDTKGFINKKVHISK